MENSKRMDFSDEKILVRAMIRVLAPLTVAVGTVYMTFLIGISLLAG